MEKKLTLSEHHLFRLFEKDLLFNVKTLLFYEVTPLINDLMVFLSECPNDDPVKHLKKVHKKAEIKNALNYLAKEQFLKAPLSPNPKPVLKKRYGIRHIELMVTHGCNMGCRYCYGAHGSNDWQASPHLYGATTTGMSLKTARSGVNFLFETSGRQKEVSVIFFGGEPLLEFELIKKLVPYIRTKEKQTGKKARLSLSTNGLLLDRAIVDYLVKQGISCQVSIDGPREIQDRNRCLPNGKGSYSRVLKGVQQLIQARKGRVPARVTLAHGAIDIPKVVDHLLSLGFGSVHAEPDNGLNPETAVNAKDVEIIKKQSETMALFLIKRVRQNRYFNYANLVKHIRQTRVVRERLAHFCGAARTYLALSQDGDFYPCHRFVGMKEYRMGNLDTGLNRSLQRKILDLTVDSRPICSSCWARYLCGGGCWKHAVDKNGCLDTPDNEVACRIIRHAIECAMAINSELKIDDQEILSHLYETTTEPHLLKKQTLRFDI